MAVIGNRFKDAGLKDFVTDTKILGLFFIESGLNEKAYNACNACNENAQTFVFCKVAT